jgi:hypothetical protein
MKDWIDANSKLPNEDTFNVLVAFDEPFFGHFNKECCVAYYEHETKKWHSELKDNGEILRVTHWQLLPKLPK